MIVVVAAGGSFSYFSTMALVVDCHSIISV